MSLPLKDLRTAVDEDTDAALEAIANVRGITKAELVRTVLQEWRDRQITIAKALEGVLKVRR